MKKLIVIVLMFIFLCTNTEIRQLLKLPVLIHHYLIHHQKETSNSFIVFLLNHYQKESTHTSANHEHENFPFKSANCNLANEIIAFSTPPLYSFKVQDVIVVKKEILLFNTLLFSSSQLTKIWQPPKKLFGI